MLTAAEAEEFHRLTEEIKAFDERIQELAAEDERSGAANAAMRRLGGTGYRESHVYNPESRASYFADLVAVSRQTADHGARERLASYDQERRDLNRADGSGGQFVPPAHLVSEYVGVPRPGRVTADLLTLRPLPAGTDVINIPKIVTGTATAIQPADNDPVQEVDLTDSTIAAPVPPSRVSRTWRSSSWTSRRSTSTRSSCAICSRPTRSSSVTRCSPVPGRRASSSGCGT